MLERFETGSYDGPDSYALADWRLRVNDLYCKVRSMSDAAKGWKLWCSVRTDLFWNHLMSPVPEKLLEYFDTIEVFDYDPSMRFYVNLIDASNETLDFELGDDGTATIRKIANTQGLKRALGNELDVFWIEGYGGGLFIPFKDASSGNETYGGGRYIVDGIKGADLGLTPSGKLILDFNFAYNPSCSISEEFVCPLAPLQNTLPVKVLAGEKKQSWIP